MGSSWQEWSNVSRFDEPTGTRPWTRYERALAVVLLLGAIALVTLMVAFR